MSEIIKGLIGIDGIYVTWIVIFLFLVLRYTIIGGIAFTLFYKLFGKAWHYKKIQAKFPSREDYKREIKYSFLTFIIFASLVVLIVNPYTGLKTKVYHSISEYGWWYFGFTLIAMMVIHDTYFYWMHRTIHHPKLYKWFHKVHHESINPSPWAAFSFHPLEAVLEASIIFIFLFAFPVHSLAIMLFLLMMTVDNVYGHLGWEIFPKGWSKHWLGKWINTSVNHNMHHRYFNSNYGLYFTFWDKIMGTTHPKYHETFDEVTSRKKPEVSQPEAMSSLPTKLGKA